MSVDNAKTPRLGDRLLGLFGLRLVVFLLAARAFLPGVLTDPPQSVAYYHDEHYYVMHDEAARRTIVDYHQVPAWNPWFCGGMIGLESPVSSEIAPDFIFRLLFGTVPGRRLTVLFFVLFGMEGTFRYARRNGASAIGAATAGVAFSCMMHFVSLLSWGWVMMFNYNLIPWLALSFEEGLRKKWWRIAGGGFMAWILLGGGSYMVPYATLALLCLFVYETGRALFRLDGEKSLPWWRPAQTLGVMALVSAGLAAIKLFPLLEFIVNHPRPVQQKDLTSPITALGMLAVPREHAGWIASAGEYYVGWAIFALGLVAVLFADRKAAKFWAVAAVFFLFACGEFVDHAPYHLMRKLPIFSQLRFPVRMLTIASLFIALAAAFGLTRLEDTVRVFVERVGAGVRAALAKAKQKPSTSSEATNEASAQTSDEAPSARAPLGVGVVGAIAATTVAAFIGFGAARNVVEHNHVAPGSIYNMEAPRARSADFHQARGNRWDAHLFPFVGLGSLHCFEENKIFTSPYVRGDLAADEYGAPGTDTKVERLSWSPHKIVLRVTSTGEGRFLVNQNHSRFWKTDVGTISSDGGVLSVRVPAGTHVVTLEYSDWRIRLGAAVMFATVLAIAIRIVRRGRFRWKAMKRLWRSLPS